MSVEFLPVKQRVCNQLGKIVRAAETLPPQ